MEAIWTASAEAILAEQSWQRSERERHQRLLNQLKLEFQQERARARKTSIAPGAITTDVPKAVVAATRLEPAAPARRERVFCSPQKSLPPVQIR